MDDITFSVAQLSQALTGFFRQAFPEDIWVTGQISNLNGGRGGHRYFDIVEPPAAPGATPEAKFSVTLFNQNRLVVNKLLKRAGVGKIEDGMAVRIRCVVDFYGKQGRLQLRMTSIDPTYTMGQMAIERQQLLSRLSDEGVLALQSRLTLTAVPRRIGLVTSVGSAAHADFTHEIAASGLSWEIYQCDSRVQGDFAEMGLVAALRSLDALRLDVIALIRGGGSRGDLTAFDSETVVRCVATLGTPVITGIGHEVDRSICDEAAHEAYKTPTACAAALTEAALEYHNHVESYWSAIAQRSLRHVAVAEDHITNRARRANSAVTTVLAHHQARVDASRQRLGRAAATAPTRVQARLTARRHRLASSGRYQLRDAGRAIERRAERLSADAPRLLERATARLELLDHQQRAYDPRKALARGWSITRDADGSVIKDPAEAPDGSVITTEFATGRLTSRVESVQP